jgi:AraC-like DNA-binding protein
MKNELNKILQYIEAHIQDNMSLSEIADLHHYSLSHLSRNFNQYVGMGFNDYVNRRKLSLIANDIRSGQKSISYLADIYGYSSQKYFSTKFKDTFSVSPSTYKKGQTFIILQPIRVIQGGQHTMINNANDLCYHLWQHAQDQNTLLDTISTIDNALLYQQNNSGISLLAYFNEGEYTNIYEIDLNLINGLYEKKSVFYVENKLHSIVTMGQEDDKHYVVFKQNATGKELTAYFVESHQPYVIFQTNTVHGFKLPEVTEEDFNMEDAFRTIDALKEQILSMTNVNEIQALCDSTEDLILMRHFGSEFVLVKLIQQKRLYAMVSLYVNMETKIAESYHFFGSVAKSEDITIRKDGTHLQLYIDQELHATSYILGGDEQISDITVRFPSGMSGSGGWDFTPEF